MSSKSIAELSADAAILIAEFSRRNKGDTVTYDELQALIGWDVRTNRGILRTVRNRLLRDHAKVLDAVHTQGYRILTDAEIVEGRLGRDREQRRRSACRSKLRAGAVNLSELNERQRLTYVAEVTVAHITESTSGTAAVQRIADNANGSTQPLALNKALEALKHNI